MVMMNDEEGIRIIAAVLCCDNIDEWQNGCVESETRL
jgi:hypothetical protein